jgi:hypothetical protein
VLVCVAASVLLFAASLALRAFHLDSDDGQNPWPGLGLLVMGWLGLFTGVVAWLANPALAAAWILILFARRFDKSAVLAALCAVGLALSFLLHRTLIRDEAGNLANITGYWLWVASAATALLASIAVVASGSRGRHAASVAG